MIVKTAFLCKALNVQSCRIFYDITSCSIERAFEHRRPGTTYRSIQYLSDKDKVKQPEPQ